MATGTAKMATGTAKMATGTAKSGLTGERPRRGVHPDSLLAVHEAGYRAVLAARRGCAR